LSRLREQKEAGATQELKQIKEELRSLKEQVKELVENHLIGDITLNDKRKTKDYSKKLNLDISNLIIITT